MTLSGGIPDFDTFEYYSWRTSVTVQTLHWFIGIDQEYHIDRLRRLLADIDFMDVSCLADQAVLKRAAMLIQDGRLAVVNNSSGLGPAVRFMPAAEACWYRDNTQSNGGGASGAAYSKSGAESLRREDSGAAKDNVAVNKGSPAATSGATRAVGAAAVGAAAAATVVSMRREQLEIEFFYRPNVLSQTVTRPVLETAHSINGPEHDAWGEGKKYSRLPSYLVWAGDYELAFNPFNQRPRKLKQK